MISTGFGLLCIGYLSGMGVWIFVSYRHKPGSEILRKLPPAVRWTLYIPFMESWRNHLDEPGQAAMERYLMFSYGALIYASWGVLILAFASISPFIPLLQP